MATTAMMCTAVAAAASASTGARPVGRKCAGPRAANGARVAVVARARSHDDASSIADRADDASVVAFGRRRAMADAAALLASSAAFPAFAEDEAPAAIAPPASAPAPAPAPKAKAVPLTKLEQPVMAFEFAYPTETSEGAPVKWATSRVRDTYSSAEPMSPDARQRIVYELISFKGPMTATVTVGPTPPGLAGKDPKEWKPKQVAESVLSDRATGRIATGQKVSLAEVEFARGEKIGDIDYVYYEYISQGSPNLAERESTTFRHSLGVTARRGAYLYTYTISAPETLWDVNAAGFEQGIKAFKLVEPNKKKFREPGNEGLLPPLPF